MAEKKFQAKGMINGVVPHRCYRISRMSMIVGAMDGMILSV